MYTQKKEYIRYHSPGLPKRPRRCKMTLGACSGFVKDLSEVIHILVMFCVRSVSFDGEHQNSCRECSISFAPCENGEPDSVFFEWSCLNMIWTFNI